MRNGVKRIEAAAAAAAGSSQANLAGWNNMEKTGEKRKEKRREEKRREEKRREEKRRERMVLVEKIQSGVVSGLVWSGLGCYLVD